MKKSVIVLIFVVIFVSVILFARFTGMVVTSINTCTDTDSKDFSNKGKVYGIYYMFTKQNYTLDDYCKDEYLLVEYYCIQEGMHSYKKSFEYMCTLGCKEGACITSEIVPGQERPAPVSKSAFEKFVDRVKNIFS